MLSRIQQMGKNLQEEIQRGLDENGSLNSKKTIDVRLIDESEADASETDEAYKDLSTGIQAKLKKLAKYEAKYPQLLEAYKNEKAKVEQIVVFEKVLQENTPASSISEGETLVEYLNSLNVKNTMLNKELTRLSKDQKANTESKEKIATLEKELKEIKNQRLESTTSTESISEVLEKTKCDLEDEREKSKRIIQELEELKVKSDGEKISRLNNEIISLKEELEKKGNLIREKDTKIESLQKSLDEFAKSSEQQLNESQTKFNEAKERFEKAEESLKTVEEKLKFTVSSLKEVESNKSELNQSEKYHKEKLDLSLKQVKDLEEVNNKLESKLKESSISSELEELKNQITEKDIKIQSLQRELKDERESWQKKNSDLEAKLTGINIEKGSKSISHTKISKNKKKKNGKKNNNVTGLESVKDTEQLPESESIPTLVADIIDDPRKKIEDLETELKQQKEEYAKLQIDYNELSAPKTRELKVDMEEIQNLRDMLSDVGNDLITSRDEVKKLTVKNKELSESALTQDHINTLEEKNKQIEKHKYELEVLRNQHSEAVTSYEKEKSESALVVKELKDNIVTLEKEAINMNELFKKSKADLQVVDELKALIEVKDKEIVSLKSELKSMNDKLSKSIKDIISLEKVKMSISLELESVNTAKHSLTQSKQKLERDLSEFIKVKKNEEYLTNELATAHNNLKHKEKTIAYFEKQVKDYEVLKAQLLDEITKQKAGAHEVNTNYKNSQDQLSRLQKERTKLEKDLADLTKQHKDVLTEVKRLRDKNEVLQDKYESLQEMKSSNSEEVEVLKKQCEELSSSFKDAKKKTQQLEEEFSENRALLQERTREASTIRRLLMEKEQSEDTKNSELQRKLQSTIDDKELIQINMDIIIARKDRDIIELKLKNEELQNIVQNWENEKKLLVKENDTLKKQKQSLERAHFNNTDNSEEVTGVLTKLKDSLSTSERKVREYEKLNNVLKKLNEELTSKLDRLTKNYKLLSNHLKEVKEKSPSPSPSAMSTRSNSVISITDLPVHLDQKESEKITYIRNIILGFLEHREQRQQLLPVISTLLQLSKTDEKRFIVALK